MPSVATRIELDIESLVNHIRDMLTKDPNAEIHINQPETSSAITVSGKVHPASATPTGGHRKP